MVAPHLEPQQAIDAVGDGFLAKFIAALDSTREDFDTWTSALPVGWQKDWADRTLANVIHDRLWSHITNDIELVPADIAITDDGTTRTLCLNNEIGLRIKRHIDGRISGYRTKASDGFYAATLEGLAVHNLAIGYEWIGERREIGRAVLSKQKTTGTDPLWVVSLDAGASAAMPITHQPIVPPQPEFDLTGLLGETAKEANGR